MSVAVLFVEDAPDDAELLLRELRRGGLEVDRTFVAGIGRRSSEAAIVRAVIALGHELVLTVVAEGVETREELAFVREHGCDQVQGFLFSRPVPAEGATELVARGAFAL